MVKIIENVIIALMFVNIAYVLIKDDNIPKYRFREGVLFIPLGILVGFEPEFSMGDRFFQIFCYLAGVYDLYVWWRDDDDFHNKRKKFWAKSKVKFKTFVVFRPPAIAGNR